MGGGSGCRSIIGSQVFVLLLNVMVYIHTFVLLRVYQILFIEKGKRHWNSSEPSEVAGKKRVS